MSKSEKTILLVVIGVVAGCLLTAFLCVAVFFIAKETSPISQTSVEYSMTTISPGTTISDTVTASACSASVEDSRIIPDGENGQYLSAINTQATLEQSSLPAADLNRIASWLAGRPNVATHLETPPIQYQIGDRYNFYKIDEYNESIATTATLRFATDEVYFWAEEDIFLEKSDLKSLVTIFSNEVYPTTQDFFGEEWIPGVDNDPHLFILYARGLGSSLAGYTSSTDYVLPEAYSYSNAHEMFVINADEESLTDLYTLSTMAHELQHVILGYRDVNEDLWLNEGFSELSTLVNGYDAGGFDYLFSLQPDMQLNFWSPDPDLNNLNYGASYLFTTYFYGRFGRTITRSLIDNPLNGFSSIDDTFRNNNVTDPSTGRLLTAEEFFRDWTLTNNLNDSNLLDGRYFYSEYENVPLIEVTDWLTDCDGTTLTETVHQFGTDYYQIGCNNPVSLKISGNPTVNVFPDNGENPTFLMWSNRGDSSDMTLTREFNLTNFSGPITFSFDVWYDLETDFDYVYPLISVDGSEWKFLNTGNCSNYNPSLGEYICAYTGNTTAWQRQFVDLSEFAGRTIRLRFESVSDGGISNDGFAIDNLSIPEIGYDEDFEAGDGGWVTEGFSRIQNLVPQTFLVSLVTSDPKNPIKKYQINSGEELELLIDPSCLDSDPILVVSASSRFTRQLAEYSITLTK